MFSHKKFKASVKSWISFQKVYGAIKFNPKICLKSYIEMNTELKKKKDFEKDFFQLMNNSVFGDVMENVRKHRDIKLVTTEKKKNHLVLEPNYNSLKFFTENLMAIEMRKTQIFINEPVHFGLSILELSNVVMYK